MIYITGPYYEDNKDFNDAKQFYEDGRNKVVLMKDLPLEERLNVLKTCDSVCFLEGFEKDKNCMEEYNYAKENNIQIRFWRYV